jgi:hypothetical protein
MAQRAQETTDLSWLSPRHPCWHSSAAVQAAAYLAMCRAGWWDLHRLAVFIMAMRGSRGWLVSNMNATCALTGVDFEVQ